MLWNLVLPEPLLHFCLQQAAETPDLTEIRLPLGLSCCAREMNLLAHRLPGLRRAEGTLVFQCSQKPQSGKATPISAQTEWIVNLNLDAAKSGQFSVSLTAPYSNRETLMPGNLIIPGQGLETISLSGLQAPPFSGSVIGVNALYSRMIGTVGLSTFRALQNLQAAIVGVGGLGSALAELLAREMAPQGRMTLIDGDDVHRYNLPHWAFPSEANPGLPTNKAQRLAFNLKNYPEPPLLEAIAASVMDWKAVDALKEANVLICCADHPRARLAVAFVAALYHKPLLDVATSVYLSETEEGHRQVIQSSLSGSLQRALWRGKLPGPLLSSRPRLYQADVRLILPGQGCLHCQGGIPNLKEFLSETQNSAELPRLQGNEFWRTRAGSRTGWNRMAVAEAADLLTAFLSGEAGPTHHQRAHQPGVASGWRPIAYTENSRCPLCRYAGCGDQALDLFDRLPSEIQQEIDYAEKR